MKLRLGFVTLLFLSALALQAEEPVFQNKQVNANPLHVTIDPLEKPVELGKQTELTFKLDLDVPHHAYLDQFKLELLDSQEYSIGEFDIQPVVTFYDRFSKKDRKGVEKTATLKVMLTRNDRAARPEDRLNFDITYQACTKDYCLFPKKLPASVKILNVEQPKASVTSVWSRVSNFDPKAQPLLLTLVLVFFAGILTSFTPCVFPMVPITLAVIGARKPGQSTWKRFILSFVYVSGIGFTYALLGLLAASTGALFGAFLGRPEVAVALAILFFAIALSNFGVFEIQSETFLSHWLATRTKSGEFLSVFLSGIFAGLIASPCVGPVLVGILTFVAQTGDRFLGFFLLLAYAFGLGLIFLLLGTSDVFQKKLPRSGPWLKVSKTILGIFFVGLSFFYLQPVLPNDWLSLGRTNVTESTENFPWEVYDKAKLAEHLKSGRPVVLDVYADWCVACKELEALTFKNPKVRDATKNFVWIKFDATKESPESTAIQKEYGIVGLPHVVIYDSNGEQRKDLTLNSFISADEFLKRIETLKK